VASTSESLWAARPTCGITSIDLILCAEEVPPELENEIVFNLDFVCLVGARQRIKSRRRTWCSPSRAPWQM
jgi:hypothetical protein